jgi:hypothetical protein
LTEYRLLRTAESKTSIRRLLAAVMLGALALVALPHGGTTPAAASPNDTITVTSPNNTTIAESDDYATQSLADPWDMSNPDDIDYVDHMVNMSFNNGIWSATTTAQTPGIFFQYQQVPNSITYITEANGVNHPISHSRYSHLRFRMYTSVADQMLVHWYNSSSGAPAGNSNIVASQVGWHIYDIDLNATGSGGTGNWNSSDWNQILFNPTWQSGHTGVNIQLDWMRLVPAAGTNLDITWTASGSNTVSLYLDTDTNASNGTDVTIATGLNAASGSYTWNTRGIAPGTYYVRATMGTASSYSGPLIVNTAPYLTITGPSTSSGEDFATSVLNNPWTMTAEGQIQAWYGVSNHVYTTSYFQASGNNDPQLWLLNNDRARPIDTSKYHYFNYNMFLAPPPGGPVNGQDYMWNGGPREIWANVAGGQWQSTQVALGWYNRWLRVGMDLATTPLEPGSNTGWHGLQSVFRFDPHEEDGVPGSGHIPAFFRLGQVRLTADPTVANGGSTTISWQPGKASGNVTLAYSTSRGGAATNIGTVPMSAGGFVWTVNGLPNGNYWIKASSSDGLNTFSAWSDVPLKVTGSHPCPSTFSDAGQGTPFYTYISNLYCRNIVEGYSDNTFRPNYAAWRATLAKWIVLARGWQLSVANGPHFTDVPITDPNYAYIETAYNHGVISGYADSTFRPYNYVTRGQMSKMVVNAMGWPIDTSGGPHFTDVPASNPFYTFIETIYNHGTVSGYADGTFRWGNNLTRGQLSKVLWTAIAP